MKFIFDNTNEVFDSLVNSELYKAYNGYSSASSEESDAIFNSEEQSLDITVDKFINIPLFYPYKFPEAFYLAMWV